MAVLYRHLKPCGEVFYIGIGEKLNRAYDTNKRSNFWKDLVKKYGHEVQILKTNLSWEEACELERILISHYGRRDLGLGTLVNMTDGGDGAKGAKPQVYSKERLIKMRASRIKASEKEIKYICTKSLKTFGSLSLCAKHTNTTVTALCAYLNPNNPAKNTTYIMKIEDYEKYGAIKPHVPEKEGIICIHTLTGRIYLNVSQAAKEQRMTYSKLSGMLFNNKILNRTFIIPILEYKGEIHYPETRKGKAGKSLRNKITGEVFPSKLSLGRHLGVTDGTITNWIKKEKIDYEYI